MESCISLLGAILMSSIHLGLNTTAVLLQCRMYCKVSCNPVTARAIVGVGHAQMGV